MALDQLKAFLRKMQQEESLKQQVLAAKQQLQLTFSGAARSVASSSGRRPSLELNHMSPRPLRAQQLMTSARHQERFR